MAVAVAQKVNPLKSVPNATGDRATRTIAVLRDGVPTSNICLLEAPAYRLFEKPASPSAPNHESFEFSCSTM
jgi:hypothetical protein